MGILRSLCAATVCLGMLAACVSPTTQLIEITSRSRRLITAPGTPSAHTHALDVTATAYNSLPGQTWGDPNVAAWGDRLEPGMQSIAVSHDLLDMGLTRGTRVKIDGLPGHWTVLDKMGRRWERRIDLYMGVDRGAALEWGRREVTIRFTPSED